MAKFFNLSSQRTSHEQVEGLPARRFTDTQLKPGQSKAVETIYRLQKNAYFQGLMNKDHAATHYAQEEKSGKGSKTSNKHLDMLVFTRKNAVLLESNPRSPMSPKQNTASKGLEGSPGFSRPSNRKISLASLKGDSKMKENLKQKVLELEKRLKNFERTSNTMRVENSADKLEKKKSLKKQPLQMTSPLVSQTLKSKPERHSPREEVDSSHNERLSRQQFPNTLTSLSKVDGDITPNLLSKSVKARSIEFELGKLRDRLAKTIKRDITLVKLLGETYQ